MNLEQAIHDRWAQIAPLHSLLPADRLTTGLATAGVAPYAVLHVRTIRPTWPTNQGPGAEEIALRITVWHDRYAELKAIAEQAREAFDGASLSLTEPVAAARVRHAADAIKQHPDGRWQWNLDFIARVYRLA